MAKAKEARQETMKEGKLSQPDLELVYPDMLKALDDRKLQGKHLTDRQKLQVVLKLYSRLRKRIAPVKEESK